jgi:hypothetical protein
MSIRRAPLAVAALLVPLAFGSGRAADHLLSGTKLVVKNPRAGAAANKVVHLGRDAAVAVTPAGGAGDPQCSGPDGGGTSSLRVVAAGGAGDVTIPLPCAGWSTNRANSLYRYKDATGATCKVVLVKGGVLVKAVCRGTHVALDVGGSMAPVAVVTTLNGERYCTEFGGVAVRDGSDGKTFLHRDAAAPAGCPTTTTSSTTSTTVCVPSCPPCVRGTVSDGCGGTCLANCTGLCCATACCSPSQLCCEPGLCANFACP